MENIQKFCPQCGDLVDLLSGTCASCISKEVLAPKERPQKIFSSNGVISTIILYFILLNTNIFFFIALPEFTSTVAAEIFASIVVIGFVASKWRYLKQYFLNFGPPKYYVIALIGGLLSFALANFLVNLSANTFNFETYNYSDNIISEGYGIGMVILLIAIQPAVIEEMAFRGFILTSFQSVMKKTDAIILSALLFMIIHLTVFSFPHLIVLGVCLGLLKIKSDSLYPCMLWHFIHNLSCVIFENIEGF